MIQLQGVSKIYHNVSGRHHSTVEALQEVNLEIGAGEFVIIKGGSGSGKTTLLQLLGGLMTPTEGSITIAGKRIDELSDTQLAEFRRAQVGFIFQDYNLIAHLSVLDNVLVPALFASEISMDDMRNRAKELLERVGLGHKLHEYPTYLSGGQKQRVAIARALLLRPALILADEPTGNLDQQTGKHIEETLFTLTREEQVTVILVTHEAHCHAQADQTIHVEQGRIVSK